ncbi:Tn3 family transposase [Streptomyces sp. NBC_00647]|uniref:Tn3 family transposase n=1 Tax=Streptomyces sp. NBC_00647 TaxID=2975796 RepID=UPI00386DBEC9
MTLMRRLSSNSRKIQNYKAFREVGRVMRTVALLRFLADSGLRARVTAATNKAEACKRVLRLDAARGGADATAVRDRRPGAGPPYEQCHRGDAGRWRSAT